MANESIRYKRSIPKSTILLAAGCAVLATTTGFFGWFAWQYTPQTPNAQVEGANIQLGLPTNQENSKRQFTASSALVFDQESGSIVFEENGFERRSIASLTKIMTAMVALDHGMPWDQEADIQLAEYTAGGNLLLHSGEKATLRDLFAASLVGSANNATLAYVRALNIPEEEFVQRMNRKAIELGLEQTEFVDVTGLDPDNVSTVYEVAKFASVAFTRYPVIGDLSSRAGYDFTAIGSGRAHTIKNTNKLISEQGEQLTGSKTGYLYEAAYCLVARGSGLAASRIAVVLGSPSESEHFADIMRLLYTE